MPRTSAKETRWPSCSSTRSSSTHVTSGSSSFETLAMMHECGSSPSTSNTSNSSPKSQNSRPNTPRTSPRMNAAPAARHAAFTATAASWPVSVHTTARCAATSAGVTASVTTDTATAGLSS